MSYTIQDLYKLSDKQLIEEHDRLAANTVMGINYFIEELRNREQAKANKAMGKLTKQILFLTVVVTIATLINLYLFAFG